jgi:hypothetical protein
MRGPGRGKRPLQRRTGEGHRAHAHARGVEQRISDHRGDGPRGGFAGAAQLCLGPVVEDHDVEHIGPQQLACGDRPLGTRCPQAVFLKIANERFADLARIVHHKDVWNLVGHGCAVLRGRFNDARSVSAIMSTKRRAYVLRQR